jgi:hypothetical protein
MSRGLRLRIVAAIVAIGLAAAGCGIVDSPPSLAPGPAFTCVGVAQQTCQQMLRDAQTNADPGTVVVALQITCTKVPCTEQQGEASVEVGYSNGRRDSYSTGWAGAVAEPELPVGPDLPVEPVCNGVPRETCIEFAQGAIVGADPTTIVSIVLSCEAACDPNGGTGETVITFSDGSAQTAGWSYEGATP